jgi:TonB family protein
MPLSGSRGGTTARQRLGLGALLSAGGHAVALIALGILISQRPPRGPEDPATDDVVAIGPIGDTAVGIPGWPTDNPPPGPAVERAAPAPAPAPPTARRPGRAAPGTRSTQPRLDRPPVATAAPVRPPAARPAAPLPATASGARGRTTAQAPTAPATAPRPAQAPTSIDVGGTGQAADPAGGAEQEGDPGSGVRAAFRSLLRKQLKAAWHPQEIYQRVDPTGQLKGSLLVTGVQVRLRADGQVDRAVVADSSGVRALDDEAMGAIRRMKLPPLPREILDDRAGFDVKCSLFLDVGMFRFARDIHRAISEIWRPSQAYRASEGMERTTILKLTLGRDGTLSAVDKVSSAGIDFLDRNALDAVRPGMRLPPPPTSYTASAGGTFMFVAFQHHLGEVHVLRPRERVDEF